MTDLLARRRKRLRFRSWHRGMKETDLILGHFADAYLDEFDGNALDQFEQLLEREDPEIFDWVSGLAPIPIEMRNPVTDLLMNFNLSAIVN